MSERRQAGGWPVGGSTADAVGPGTPLTAPPEWLPADVTSDRDEDEPRIRTAPVDWMPAGVVDEPSVQTAAQIAPAEWLSAKEAPSTTATPVVARAPSAAPAVRAAFLRFGLPGLVVVASLAVVLAIAGVFGSGERHRVAGQQPTAAAAARPTSQTRSANTTVPKPVTTPPQRRAHSQAASPAPTRRAPAPTTPVTTAHTAPLATPAPRAPVNATPPPAPAPRHQSSVQRISKTRPTQRSSAPGRQATGG
jgi:hypothetical protein